MRRYEVFNDTSIYRLLKNTLLSMMNIYIVHVYLEYNMLSTTSALWNACAWLAQQIKRVYDNYHQ